MKAILSGLFLIGVIISFSLNSYSQSGSSYFPLHIGNEWTFTFQNSLHTEEIVDTIRINGFLYYELSIWSPEPQYWFRESNDSVYLLDRIDSTEILLYNFNADSGESWELTPDYDCSFGSEITLLSKNDTVVTPAGTFTNCYHLLHQQNCSDAGIFESWFGKGIGRIRYVENNIAGMKDYKLVEYKIFPPVDVGTESSFDISYNLSQNYPNPFNPSTRIQYAVSSMQFVTIKVYDVLGREVATLVNEEKQRGFYEVEFNASNLSSGIYFYTLTAGSFNQTKKLILLK